MTFEEALKQQFTARRAGKQLTLWELNLKKLLDAKPSARRTRILKRLESHARVQLGYNQTQAIDWGAVDWAKVFDVLLKFLLAILPLLLL